MLDVTTHLGVLYVGAFIGEAQSLKAKRMVLISKFYQAPRMFLKLFGISSGRKNTKTRSGTHYEMI